MEYSKLRDKFFGKYPTTDYDGNELPVDYEFIRKGNFIIRRGRTTEAQISFPIESVDNIKVPDDDTPKNPLTFRFLIRFDEDDNDIWTSRVYLDDLKAALKDNIPYFSISRSNIVDIPFEKAGSSENQPYSRYYKFEEPYTNTSNFKAVTLSGLERDVGVDMKGNLNTKESLIRHIDWFADNDRKELRPANESDKNGDGVSGIGSWEIL